MAAQYGTVTFERPNRTRFTYSVYFDDTAGNPVRFARDGKSGTAAPDNIVATEIMGIVDICLAAATGQTTTVIKVNDNPVSTILNAIYLASITTRPEPGTIIFPGQKLTMVQIA